MQPVRPEHSALASLCGLNNDNAGTCSSVKNRKAHQRLEAPMGLTVGYEVGPADPLHPVIGKW